MCRRPAGASPHIPTGRLGRRESVAMRLLFALTIGRRGGPQWRSRPRDPERRSCLVLPAGIEPACALARPGYSRVPDHLGVDSMITCFGSPGWIRTSMTRLTAERNTFIRQRNTKAATALEQAVRLERTPPPGQVTRRRAPLHQTCMERPLRPPVWYPPSESNGPPPAPVAGAQTPELDGHDALGFITRTNLGEDWAEGCLLVGKEGVEPSHPLGHWHLGPARLPLRHFPIQWGRVLSSSCFTPAAL